MQLEDRFYTSTEVAEILGVSLRSVYRYLEDSKLKAEVKTATGRHRFTKQDILNFLYPDGKQQIFASEISTAKSASVNNVRTTNMMSSVTSPISPAMTEEQPKEDTEVDWLAKFREAASKYKEEQNIQPQPVMPQPQPQVTPQTPAMPAEPMYSQPVVQPQSVPAYAKAPVSSTPVLMYYRSMLGGLKDIAQNIDKSARNSDLNYAFTLNAGASLHKPIKPFAILHVYINPNDRDFFEKILRLTPASESNAQLCLILSDDPTIYTTKEEVHGLYVVGKEQLRKDINSFGNSELAREISDILI